MSHDACPESEPRPKRAATERYGVADSPRAGRLTPRVLIASVLTLAGLGFAAAVEGGDGAAPFDGSGPKGPEPREAVLPHRASTLEPGRLALSYQPTNHADRGVAALQARVRQSDSADAYVSLALGMLQRKRETSDAAYLHYAVDALAAARARDAVVEGVLLVETLIAQDGHRFRDALSHARRLTSRRPSDPTGHLLAGDALLELGEYQAATDSYQQAMDLRPDLRSYNRTAHLRWLHGDFEGAREAIELALDAGSPRDPESMAWCWVDLGNMLLAQGDAKSALAAAARAELLVQGYQPALVLRGRSLAMQGNRTEAIAALTESVERAAHVADLLMLSELLTADGRQADAARRLRQAEQLAGADPRPLALYYARHGERPERALELAEQELARRKNLEAHDAHALALIRLGRFDQAAAALDRAMALGTRDADLHLHRALLHRAGGDMQAARASLARARSMNPHADALLVAEIEREAR